MDIIQLQSFIYLMRYLNFTKAAELSCVTQSAMTKRIKKMEQELGVTLFELAGKQVIPTNSAKQLLPYAEKIVLLSRTSIDAVHNPEKYTLSLKVGLSLYVIQEFFKDIFAALSASTLSCQFKFFQVEREEIIKKLQSSECDLVIATGIDEPMENIHKQVLFTQELACVTKNDTLLNASQPISLELLNEYPAVLTCSNYSIRKRINRIFAKQDLNLNLLAELNSLAAIAEVLSQYDAWSILPTHYLNESLVQIYCENLPTQFEICVYLHKERLLSKSIQSTLVQLKSLFIERQER